MASLPHTKSGSREYRAWSAMKTRCYNRNAKCYHNYGGRGISVCDRWLNGYDAFLRDMGRCPEGHSLDRIDNDGPYSPDNCRWADAKTQARNTAKSTAVLWRGRAVTFAELAESERLNYGLLAAHLNRGVPVALAIWRARAMRAHLTGEAITHRVCAKCLQELPLACFGHQRQGILGTYPQCDACRLRPKRFHTYSWRGGDWRLKDVASHTGVSFHRLRSRVVDGDMTVAEAITDIEASDRPRPGIQAKTCDGCGGVYPLSDFHKNQKGVGGRRNICRRCQNARVRERYRAKAAGK